MLMIDITLPKHLYLSVVYFNMYNLMLWRTINIRKKIVYISICLLIFASFSGAATFEKNLIQPLKTKSANQN